MTNDQRKEIETDEAARAIVDAVIADWREQDRVLDEALGPDYRQRLLAGFDDFQRRRRARLSLSSFAEAFGWRALGRPLAPAGILAALCAIGFIVGASATGGGAEEELIAALDQSFDYSVENAW